MNWRPIETAPKDETDILLHWDYLKITGMAYWCLERNDWYALEGDTNYYTKPPTHWMPLPPPPSTEPAPQDTGEKWKTSGTGHLCCNGIPVAQFIEPVCQDGRYIPQALNLLAGHDLSHVVVVKKEVVDEVKGALNAGIQAAMHCTLNATYHMRVMNESIISLEKAQALASLNV